MRFKVVAINLYGNIDDVESFELWEDIFESDNKNELVNMISNNNQILSIDELSDNI